MVKRTNAELGSPSPRRPRRLQTDEERFKIYDAAIAFVALKDDKKSKKGFLDGHGKQYGLEADKHMQDFSTATQALVGKWPEYAKKYMAAKKRDGGKLSLAKYAKEKVDMPTSDRAKAKVLGVAVKIQEYKTSGGKPSSPKKRKTAKTTAAASKPKPTKDVGMFGTMWSFVKGILPF